MFSSKLRIQVPDNELENNFLKECSKGEHLKHQELLAFYYEVKESLSAQSTLVLVEPADTEVTFKSDI